MNLMNQHRCYMLVNSVQDSSIFMKLIDVHNRKFTLLQTILIAVKYNCRVLIIKS